MKCQSIQKFICSSCFTAKRKIKNGLFPLKYLILGFHPNTTLSFFLCLIFPYNVFSKLKSNFYRVVAFLRAVYYNVYDHVIYMYYTMYIYFTQLHHHVSDSAMSMARTRTALPYWMSLKNVMLWREGERTRWMPWFVQWCATVLLSMVIIYTSLSCHHSCHQTKETVPTEIAFHWLLNDFISLLTFQFDPVCWFFKFIFLKHL